MLILPSTFRSDGYDFTLIKRTGDVCLFSKHKRGHRLTHYEVVIVQKVETKTFPDGTVTPAHEAMPSPSDWGEKGWTPYDLPAAHKRFDQTVRDSARR